MNESTTLHEFKGASPNFNHEKTTGSGRPSKTECISPTEAVFCKSRNPASAGFSCGAYNHILV